MPITIIIGTTPFMTALETLAAMIRRFLVMISFTALIPQAPRSAMTALATKSEWPQARNGLVAVTWMSAMAHRLDT
jgi:hypothetical protein